ncbi:ABC transporter ATP-binding protein [uncultured Clostridium sp.]|uniref:ABC transporter ATP-binding protein n=1 Tax=uncultured Clostridium sp. TaxID=59620 RepID=UPI0025E02240|nr:ATP-binding cassette domain-containing protein [uncultured Clostridium sp.]
MQQKNQLQILTYPHMTVEDNIAFGLKNIKTPKDEIKKKVDWAVEILGLEEYRKRKPKNLSGGQRQRVALGRAIVRDQKVFLMDEPLSNLDAKLRVSMRNEISKLHRQLGATTIYVTHDQVEAMTMADRIVVMKDGIIQQIGSPMELYDNPKNKFVASFIGAPQMNFLPVEVKGNEAVFEDGNKIIIPGGIVKKLNGRSGKLLMGVRGEDIKLDNLNLGLFEESVFTSVIDNTEIMGNENNLYFKIGNTNVIARVGKEDVKQIGESFKFVINANKIHFFDLETEENIMN